MSDHHHSSPFTPLNIAILTVSDTRTLSNDSSGQALQHGLEQDGHHCIERQLCSDDRYQIRAHVSRWVADPKVHVVLVTGGTGFYGRDITPEALTPLFDKTIDGFGEVFRALSLQEIGLSTMQSRAVAGIANHTGIFAIPGSTNACKTAWAKILHNQLDSRTKPCNFVAHFKV